MMGSSVCSASVWGGENLKFSGSEAWSSKRAAMVATALYVDGQCFWRVVVKVEGDGLLLWEVGESDDSVPLYIPRA